MVEPQGRERCMIFRRTGRILKDGCDVCGVSVVACAAYRDIESRPCCEGCRHEEESGG